MEILKYILGANDLGYFVSFYLFALFGFAVYSYIRYSDKNYNAEFSLIYFVADNYKDIIVWILCTFLAARFRDVLSSVLFSVKVTPMLFAFGWGYLNISVIKILKSKYKKTFGRKWKPKSSNK